MQTNRQARERLAVQESGEGGGEHKENLGGWKIAFRRLLRMEMSWEISEKLLDFRRLVLRVVGDEYTRRSARLRKHEYYYFSLLLSSFCYRALFHSPSLGSFYVNVFICFLVVFQFVSFLCFFLCVFYYVYIEPLQTFFVCTMYCFSIYYFTYSPFFFSYIFFRLLSFSSHHLSVYPHLFSAFHSPLSSAL